MVMCMFVIVSALTYLENHTDKRHTLFLANVNSLIAVARPPVCLSVCLSSVVCNARAPYSDSCKFRQFYYGIWYLWPSVDMHRKSYGDRLWTYRRKRSNVWSKLGLLTTNRKPCMSFRLVLKSVTLNDLERRNGHYYVISPNFHVRCRRKTIIRPTYLGFKIYF